MCPEKNLFLNIVPRGEKYVGKLAFFRTLSLPLPPMKPRTHIVGLRYYGLRELADRLDSPEAQKLRGETLFLSLDPQCTQDATAVMAWNILEPVGHVCHTEKDLIVNTLLHGKRDMLEAIVVGIDPIRRGLEVELVDELLPFSADAETPDPYASWTYGGPVMPPPQCWAKADHLMRMMECLADGKMKLDDKAHRVVEAFWQETLCDLSGETYARRVCLAESLQQSTDPELHLLGRKLFRLIDHMGSNELVHRWSTEVLNTILGGPSARCFSECYADLKADQLRASLLKFPHDLGRIWLSGDGQRFASCLHYAKLPRRLHLELYSLLVLHTAACYRIMNAPANGSQQPSPLLQLSMNTAGVDSLHFNNHGTYVQSDRIDHLNCK